MQLARILTNYLDRAESQRNNQRAYARCKRKAKKLGVTVEIERDAYGNGYWLHGTGRGDGNFCTSWQEVESNLDSLTDDDAPKGERR